MLRQHRCFFSRSLTVSDVNKQSYFVSDICRKYLGFLEESIYSRKRWLQI